MSTKKQTKKHARQRFPKLQWLREPAYTAAQTFVAVRDRITWVMTRVLSGRRNRFNLVLCDSSEIPIIIGNELTEKHCKQIAQEQYVSLIQDEALPKRTRSIRRMHEQSDELMLAIVKLVRQAARDGVPTVKELHSQLNRLGILQLVRSWMLLDSQVHEEST